MQSSSLAILARHPSVGAGANDLTVAYRPIYYVPGNHDVFDTNSLANYRGQFGQDYYSFQVKNVKVLMLDSELLGNYTNYNATTLSPLPPGMAAESQNMLTWLTNQAGSITGQVVIAVQHIPLFNDSGNSFPPGNLPYWTVNPPYAQTESNLLISLGVKDMLAGHWHNGRFFNGCHYHPCGSCHQLLYWHRRATRFCHAYHHCSR